MPEKLATPFSFISAVRIISNRINWFVVPNYLGSRKPPVKPGAKYYNPPEQAWGLNEVLL
jgi:hypothetical protein